MAKTKKGKRFVGRVVSDKMEKTVVVVVERRRPHRYYGKVVARRTKIYADDSLGVKVGDKVEVKETRPLSRLKRFVVTEIVKE